MDWTKPANDDVIERVADALRKRGMQVFVVNNRDEAREKALELMPKGSEVMRANSISLDQSGLTDAIQSDDYISLKEKLVMMKDNIYLRNDAWRKALTPQYGIGSVHAITEGGEVVTASASGSQLSFYSYSAEKIIWVVGAQKIVKDLDQAFKRIYEYTLPLVSDEVKKLLGIPGVSVNKLLIVEKEPIPFRTTVILVKERLGF
jgi:hypothetical protein